MPVLGSVFAMKRQQMGNDSRTQASATQPAAGARMCVAMPINPADSTTVIEVISAAFISDPTWSWAFPEPAARRRWWVHCIENALRYPCAFKTDGFEAVSIWIPPGGIEFSPESEKRIPALLNEVAGARASVVSELLCRFEQAHPHHVPHYYLSLLATQDAHRGRGHGMALLRENLSQIDAAHMPAYLESSNPANNARYETLGFVPAVCFRAPGDGPIVTGMWREKR
jgi:GNAT superfamily N-acetyltransferase